MKDNELIAEFMGLESGYMGVGIMYRWGTMSYKPEALQYDTSWDWLMPAVEKIESLEFTFVIDNNEANILSDVDCDKGLLILKQYPTKIQSVYAAVVEFIKWYNSQKQ
jgi:hypothetical protein